MTLDRQLATHFAPPERATPETLQRQICVFQEYPLLDHILDAAPDIFLILNQQRQIVFANHTLLNLLDLHHDDLYKGLRPGEALGCAHAHEEDGGCGTSQFCRNCGAVRAILSALRGAETIQECRILRDDGSALDLQVWTKPLELNGQTFSVFAAKDISHEKRRRILERIFFHDILNTAGTLAGFIELMQDMDADQLETITNSLSLLSQRLIDEIRGQKQITDAENDELLVHVKPVNSLEFLHEIRAAYAQHTLAKRRQIVIAPEAASIDFTSDDSLLGRVIGNMIKNALEACAPGQTVTLSCMALDRGIEFSVHNPGFIPRSVQLQIFQRSFSTKGEDRGLGTYSMKLLTERYLGGSVTFTSDEIEGTRFFVRYPLSLPT